MNGQSDNWYRWSSGQLAIRWSRRPMGLSIALFRSSPDQFELVLTDLEMPVMNGQQFVKLARKTNVGVKIICMSGFTNGRIPENTEFLPKPFSPAALRASVDKLLKQP